MGHILRMLLSRFREETIQNRILFYIMLIIIVIGFVFSLIDKSVFHIPTLTGQGSTDKLMNDTKIE